MRIPTSRSKGLSRERLLITGARLQNRLKELFVLPNFICPEIFVDYADLDSFLHKHDNDGEDDEEKSRKVVEALHKILRPFLLRRVKADVEKVCVPVSSGFCFIICLFSYRDAAQMVSLCARKRHRRSEW